MLSTGSSARPLIGAAIRTVKDVRADVEAAFAEGGGLLLRREQPGLARHLDHLLAAGQICSPLPGVLACREVVEHDARIAAGVLWAGPDAIVVGLAAARLSFWPEAPLPRVELCSAGHARSRPGWTISRRRIPPDLVRWRGRIGYTSPALTAVDLAAGPLGGDIIDRVLRTRSATLAQMWRALELMPGRRANRQRAALLHDSRDEPWSEAERELHRLLRGARLTGWRTNVEVGAFVADVLFVVDKLIIEVDGYAVHGAREAFEYDRARRNALVLAGYTVLNFTWRQLVERPEWVIDCIRRALGRPGARRD